MYSRAQILAEQSSTRSVKAGLFFASCKVAGAIVATEVPTAFGEAETSLFLFFSMGKGGKGTGKNPVGLFNRNRDNDRETGLAA